MFDIMEVPAGCCEGARSKPGEPKGKPSDVEEFGNVVEEMLALHERKQADYGRDGDPFANIRASEEFGIRGWMGAVLRANDKMSRIKTFALKGNLQNESFEDALMDLGVYAMIALTLWRLDRD